MHTDDRTGVVIMGAGGRDFHVFNTCYRDGASREVIAFTATQIPGIGGRTYPPALSGPRYPEGIPIVDESELERVIRDQGANEVVFAYSDVSREYVKEVAARVYEAGASFALFDPDRTMLRGTKPCVAVCAVRTGCGKSPLSRHVCNVLRGAGRRVAVLRHPMAYGNLTDQIVQRFETIEDLSTHQCTLEEMEEYEPHIRAGNLVFAGADYARILEAAEKEADVILWDGGNNDLPFVKPDLHLTLVDPLRPGHEVAYFPSLWNLERADAIVISKIDEARSEDLEVIAQNIREHNPGAKVLEGRSPITLSDPGAVQGKRALVIEDGPTATHGGMGYGAGYLAAVRAGAAEIVDPRPYATGKIAAAFQAYPHLRSVLPALGYGELEIRDLQATIEKADCDVVVVGTPVDLARVLDIGKPHVRATYDFKEASSPGVADLLREMLAERASS